MSYTNEIARAVQHLLIAGIAFLAYRTARDAKMSTWPTVWRGLLWCSGLAAFAAITLGQPSCDEQGDPIHGGCEAYADDGFDPTVDQRIGRFLYLFTLLSVPVLIGAVDRRRDPHKL